jgi:hypothetical protein
MAPPRWLIITLALGLLVASPTAEAPQRGNIPLVGVLEPNPATTGCFAAFQQGLRDLGYVEGQNITFTYRYAAHQFDRLPALATCNELITSAALLDNSARSLLRLPENETALLLALIENELTISEKSLQTSVSAHIQLRMT